jgi:hypothetical protein
MAESSQATTDCGRTHRLVCRAARMIGGFSGLWLR